MSIDFDIPKYGITITFADGVYQTFPQALATAQQTLGYQTCLKAKTTWHMATYPDGITEALPLIRLLDYVRNKKIYVDGEEISWGNLYSCVECMQQKITAYDPTKYCFGSAYHSYNIGDKIINPWGCRCSNMDWNNQAWLNYGYWHPEGLKQSRAIWVLDKAAIRHNLLNNISKVQYCPYINEEYINNVLNNLPELIEPNADKSWQFSEDYKETIGSIQITEVAKDDGFSTTRTYHSNGVKLADQDVMKAIMINAAKGTDFYQPINQLLK